MISTLSLFLSTSEEPRKTNIMAQQSAKAIKLVFSFNAPKYELSTSFLIERNNDVLSSKLNRKKFKKLLRTAQILTSMVGFGIVG